MRIVLLVMLALGCERADSGPAGGTPPPSSDADFIQEGNAFVDQMVAVFQGTNCDQVAKHLDALVTKSKPRFRVLKAYADAHPGVQQKLEASYKPRQTELFTKMGPTLQACGATKALQDAIARLTAAVQQP
jgi:hypothetical protein